MKVLRTETALRRIEEVAAYIAMDGPAAAGRRAQAILRKGERLKDFPESGRAVPEIGKRRVREILAGNYRIIHRIDARTVHILTVRHAKQILPMQEIR